MTKPPTTAGTLRRKARRINGAARFALYAAAVTGPGAVVVFAPTFAETPVPAAIATAVALGVAVAALYGLSLAPTGCDEPCDLAESTGKATTIKKTVARRSLHLIAAGGAIFRFLATPLVRLFYRIDAPGVGHVPRQGPALLVANHVSYMDPALIQVAVGRPIRFLMHREFFLKRWLNPIGRLMQVVPIASHDSPRELLRSLRAATECLKNGELVCIFAEGGVTRTGELRPFSRGLELILRGTDAPVIPIGLGNIRGTFGSFVDGHMVRELPHPMPHRVTVAFGPPLPATAAAPEIRECVRELCPNTRGTAPQSRRATAMEHSPAA